MSNNERAKLTPKPDTLYAIAETLYIKLYQLLINPETTKRKYIPEDLPQITKRLDGNDKTALNDILSFVIQSMKKREDSPFL